MICILTRTRESGAAAPVAAPVAAPAAAPAARAHFDYNDLQKTASDGFLLQFGLEEKVVVVCFVIGMIVALLRMLRLILSLLWHSSG